MRKRETSNTDKITVSIKELQEMTSLGEQTSRKIAKQAGAVIKIGKRTVYDVEKIRTYLESLRKEQSGE